MQIPSNHLFLSYNKKEIITVNKKAFEIEHNKEQQPILSDEEEQVDPFMKNEINDSEETKVDNKIVNEWTPDLEKIEKEAAEIEESAKKMREESSPNDSDQDQEALVKDSFPDTPDEILNRKE